MLSSTTAATANISPLLDRKIEEISAGISASYSQHLRSAGQDNVTVIIDYIVTMKSEVNLSDHYRRDLIEVLSKFSKFNDNKSFKDLKRSDVIAFLETYRRTEAQDPLHKWIGTYNIYRIHLMRFFKWLYNPDIEPDKRPKPALIENIPQLKRKEKSIYKPSDLWTQQGRPSVSEVLSFQTRQVLSCYIQRHFMSSSRNSQTKDKGYCLQDRGI